MSTNGYFSTASEPDRSCWQRLLSLIFPATRFVFPEEENWVVAVIRTDVKITMSVADRLRALISGKLHVVVMIHTDVAVDKTNGHSVFCVKAP